MRGSLVKVVVVGLLASAGLVAEACGGGSDEAPPPAMPTAQASTPAASSTPSATPTTPPSASATPPPPVEIPPAFTAAAASVKAATDKLTPLLTKTASCDVLAAELTKFAKDNEQAFATFNTEAAKLTVAQKQAAEDQANADNGMTSDEQAKLMASMKAGALGTCIAKKDKKVETALMTFVAAMTAGMKSPPPLTPNLGGAPAPKPTATPSTKPSASPLK